MISVEYLFAQGTRGISLLIVRSMKDELLAFI